MDQLSDHHKKVLDLMVSNPAADDRTLAAAVRAAFGQTLPWFRRQLTAALAHPDGFAYVHRLEQVESERQTMPEDLLEILLFEARWRPDGGRKTDAVRARFGISQTTYRSRLERALRHEAAERIAPSVVRMNGRQVNRPQAS